MAADKFHSKILGENSMSSVITMRHAIWAEAVHIIDKAAEAEVVALDIKVHHLQSFRMVVEWAAMAEAAIRLV